MLNLLVMSVKWKRELVLDYHKKGMHPNEIFKAAKSVNLNRMFIKRTIDRFEETFSIEDRARPGRPRSSRTTKLINLVRAKIRRNPRRSMRKMAKEAKTSLRTISRVCKLDLHVFPYKLQKRQLLSAPTIEKRLRRSKKLLNRMKRCTLPNIVFSDEKLFTVQQAHNRQNDRVLSKTINSIPVNTGKVLRSQKPASVMVWAAVSKRGKSPLVFIPQGVKINKELYVNKILEGSLLPWSKSVFGDEVWTFQQDGATSHTSRLAQQWCEDHCPSWISKEEWPPSSPDLNVLDYSLWSILESKACSTPCKNIGTLKRKLIKAWKEIPLDIVRKSIDAFPGRLRQVVKANGKHFE